ncbi:MAG TPA: hypothetical protein VIK73_11310 [Limnochordales bacterium]
MFQVAPEDVLRGLKRFKRLAKQDILASSKTPNPQYWTRHAEARRKVYDLLMETIQREGLEAAYHVARQQLAELARAPKDDADHAGREQALTLFFTVLGLSPEQTAELRQEMVEDAAANSSALVN